MSAPKQHKAAQIKEVNGKYAIETIDTPQPGPTEVLIKVTASGICASGMFPCTLVQMSRISVPYLATTLDHFAIAGTYGPTYPLSPGHEVVGKIVAHGKDINQKLWPNGKKVGAGWNGGYCTRCTSCRKGDFIHCQETRVTGINQQGGHQEYLIIDETALVDLPANANMSDAELAPLLCAGNTVYQGRFS